MKEYSETEKDFHSVTLESYSRNQDFITLCVMDPLSKNGRTFVKVPTSSERANVNLKPDDWRLGSNDCYTLILN